MLDVHLPDIHRLEVCRLLRRKADAYLIAPVSPEELTGTLDKLLATVTRVN